MREIELTPKANEDLENIWLYGFETFGMEKPIAIFCISLVILHNIALAGEERNQDKFIITSPHLL